MAHGTAEPREAAEQNQAPPDIATMRETVGRILEPDAVPDALPPRGNELETLTAELCGHIAVLAPAIEQAARVQLKPGTLHKWTVLQCAWEARSRLEATPSSRYGGPVTHARRLARSLNALCDHYDRLASVGEVPGYAALRRLGEHCAACATCRALGEDGAKANLPCTEADRLYDEYRQARRAAVPCHDKPPPLASADRAGSGMTAAAPAPVGGGRRILPSAPLSTRDK